METRSWSKPCKNTSKCINHRFTSYDWWKKLHFHEELQQPQLISELTRADTWPISVITAPHLALSGLSLWLSHVGTARVHKERDTGRAKEVQRTPCTSGALSPCTPPSPQKQGPGAAQHSAPASLLGHTFPTVLPASLPGPCGGIFPLKLRRTENRKGTKRAFLSHWQGIISSKPQG